MTTAPSATPQHAMSEPYGFILLQWPCLLALLAQRPAAALSAAAVALAIVLVLLQVSAWRRGGAGFGNALLCAQLCIVAAWALHPSSWALAPLGAAIVLILVAQFASLRRAGMAA